MTLPRRLIRWLASLGTADGLDTTEYIERVEREFAIPIPAEAAESFATLNDLCNYVAANRRQHGRPLDSEEIWNTVRTITSEGFGIDPSELHPRIRYVEDLLC
jgi:hypothetical protein